MKIKNKVTLSALAILAGAMMVVPGVRAAVADDTEDVTLNATVDEAITLSVSTNTLALTPNLVSSSAQNSVATADLVATVSTNDTDGWELKIKDKDNDLTLKNSSNGFAAHTAAFATPATFPNSNVWGYRLNNFSANEYAGITAGDVTIAQNGAPASAVATTVRFAAQLALNSTLPAGTYTDTIVLTAHVK